MRRSGLWAVTLTAAILLTACGPTGGPAGGMGGMSGGGMGGMGGMHGRSTATGEAPQPVAGARELTVEAGDLYFDPATLQVRVGEPVNITVTNVGEVFHDFTILDLDFMLDLDPGVTATGGLVIDEPGEYRFECTVPGHAAAGMRGTLVVNR